MRKLFCHKAICLVVIVLLVNSVGAANEPVEQPSAAAKPNVLFIFADDLAYDCLRCYGNNEVETPNLDRLARRGTMFSHCYNMGAWGGAVCVASRTMLNTGHFIWRAHGDMPKLNRELVPAKQMWSQRMASAGYDTYMTGKWHVKADTKKIFGTAKNVRGGMPNQVPAGYNRPLGPDDKAWLPWDPKHEGFWKGGKHWSEVVADDALQFIETAKAKQNPFFMYIAFNAAHDPRQAPKEFVDKYPLDKISLPQPFYQEYPYALGMKTIRDEKLAPFPRTEYAVKVNRQEYYAIITHMDVQIGKILDALQASGKADNTYIFFTADHGLAVGHHGLMGKQNLYDHSVRVPFMVAGPAIDSRKKLSTPIYLQDVMPTSLEIAAANTDGVQFKSILPVLNGDRKQSYESIFGCYTKTQRSIVKDGYKLIVYPGLKTKLLYDLTDDPQETNNLAADPAHQALLEGLLGELRKLQREMADELDI